MTGRRPEEHPDPGRAGEDPCADPAASVDEPAASVDEPAASVDEPADRADRVAERLAMPVLIAALASVPAVFLTLMDEPYQSAGSTLNTISGGVLIAETVVLFAVSDQRLTWVRRNLWLVALAVVMIPAVIFAVGPVQLLRLVRVVGALRIIRVGRIFKAGRIVRERAGLDAIWQRIIGAVLVTLVASFVALVLSDPTSQSRQLLDGAVERIGVIGVLLAGTVLAVATYIVRTNRNEEREGRTDRDQHDHAEQRAGPDRDDGR